MTIEIQVIDRDDRTHRLAARPGGTLMELLRDADLGVAAICGGQCACATCHCLLEPDGKRLTGEPGADERELLASLEHFDAARSRLACQLEVSERLDGLRVTLAPEE